MSDRMTKTEALSLLPAWEVMDGESCAARAFRTVVALTDEVERLRAQCEWMESVLSFDSPRPVHDVLEVLADAADHLLNDHSCDRHGWEGVGLARDSAREILAKMREAADRAGGSDV